MPGGNIIFCDSGDFKLMLSGPVLIDLKLSEWKINVIVIGTKSSKIAEKMRHTMTAMVYLPF